MQGLNYNSYGNCYSKKLAKIQEHTIYLGNILFSYFISFSSLSLHFMQPVYIFTGSLVVASAVVIQSYKRSSTSSLHEKKDKVYSRKLSYPISSVSFPNSFSPELYTYRKTAVMGRVKRGH